MKTYRLERSSDGKFKVFVDGQYYGSFPSLNRASQKIEDLKKEEEKENEGNKN